ncbi:MAG: pilus assembly protein CpaF [Rubinisphaera sp.]|nr:pilus assembly protein CpaF [Rubinisphaera sp.]
MTEADYDYESNAESKRAFQQLKTRLHRQMIDAMDLSKAGKLPEHELRKQLRALAAHLCDMHSAYLPESEREQMVNEIMDEMYGFGPLEPLMNDPDVSDVLINGADTVFVERRGKLERTDVRFADNNHLLHLIQRLVGRAGRRIDEVSPMVDAKLPDGSRLHAVIPPLTSKGPTLSIRRFSKTAVEFEDMVRSRSLTREMADFLIACVRGRMNILLSGGTGAGKTTMLNQLSRFIPMSERVLTIEETAELQLKQTDVVSMETRLPNVEGKGGISQRELLRNSLRMRPDRIIVGEARGSEVLEMLQAMNTGHDGSMSTVHANDTRDALDRLELMIALSGADLTPTIARRYIASALQILVHVSRLSTGERKVMRISEVAGTREGEYNVEDIFVYRMTGIGSDGRAEGAFYATGYEPECIRRMTTLGHDVSMDLFTARELIAGGEYIVQDKK